MRVLMLNWRDIGNPRAGGAELITLRVLEGLAELGCRVEWFSSSYPGARPEEERNGVRYVRRGNEISVRLHAAMRYRGTQSFDVVIDQINTLPFWAASYTRVPVVAYFNQLAREVLLYERGSVVGGIGALAERLYLLPYKRKPIITISDSSAASLREYGLAGPTRVVPMCVDEQPDEDPAPKTAPHDIAVVGRIVRSKRIEHCLDAAKILSDRGWRGRLIVIGNGEPRYVNRLKRRASELLSERVVFKGFVSEAERSSILRAVSCLWVTSVREGWGLVVTEAARHGTPAVGYRVPGLVDSIEDGVTGVLVDPSPLELALATEKLFSNGATQIGRNALKASLELSWSRTVHEFYRALQDFAR